MPTSTSKVNARFAEFKASADRSRTLVEEDRRFKRAFYRTLPPRHGRWPRLRWSLESASAFESVDNAASADSAAQTSPSW